MFTIIGGDGKEYGPASAEQIREWIASGRATLETRARRSGEDTWKPLSSFDEFKADNAPEAGPPPLASGIPSAKGEFTIIGGDGKEYGPVATAQLREWIAAGRANLETRARRTGDASWQRLESFPEFGPGGGQAVAATAVFDAEPGGRVMRLGAVLLDQLIVMLCVLASAPFFGVSFFEAMADESRTEFSSVEPGRIMMGAAVLLLLLGSFAVVQIWWLTTRGQTVGKRMLRLKIVRVADGGNPGFVNAFLLRSLVPAIISGVPLAGPIFSLTDVLFIFRGDRRCIHDLMAGTRVVRV